jgi:hypothetical protein
MDRDITEHQAVMRELKTIRESTDRLCAVLEEFLPLMRKAAAIKAMNPAALVKEAVNKRAKSRSVASGENGSGQEG